MVSCIAHLVQHGVGSTLHTLCDRLSGVDETMTELPELDNDESLRLRTFIQWLDGKKPFPCPVKIIR